MIHYDPWWNVAAQNQATDRAHRIGQENQVSVFKLITKHTIEENILKLQEMKRDLADTVVTEGTGALSSITREDLIRMLDEDLYAICPYQTDIRFLSARDVDGNA